MKGIGFLESIFGFLDTELKMKNKNTANKKKLELLNSEGAILTATKGNASNYIITDQYGEKIANWNRFGLLQFLAGEDVIKDSTGKVWLYSAADEGMKPSDEKIQEFIEPDPTSNEELKEILKWAYPHILESVSKTEGQYRTGCDFTLNQIEEILGLTFKEMKDVY
jgi:hypothetical protein